MWLGVGSGISTGALQCRMVFFTSVWTAPRGLPLVIVRLILSQFLSFPEGIGHKGGDHSFCPEVFIKSFCQWNICSWSHLGDNEVLRDGVLLFCWWHNVLCAAALKGAGSVSSGQNDWGTWVKVSRLQFNLGKIEVICIDQYLDLTRRKDIICRKSKKTLVFCVQTVYFCKISNV